jgi:hypothetical protein
MPTPDRPKSDTAPAVVPASANGTPKTVPANLPPPKAGEDVTVDVRLRYDTTADGVASTNAPRVTPEQAAEMRRVAATQAPRAAFGRRITELDEWLEYWRTFVEMFEMDIEGEDAHADVSRFKMSVLRLADDVVMPGQSAPFLNMSYEDRPLQRVRFTVDFNQFIGTLQTLNGGSGGRFRVTLIDAQGDFIRKAWYGQERRGGQIIDVPIEGQQNATWEGVIPNPLSTNNPNAQRQAPAEKRDELTELARDMLKAKLQKVITGEDDKPASNNLLDTVNAQAAATVVTKMGEALTAVAKATSEAGGKEKAKSGGGFWNTLGENVAGSEEMVNRAFGMFDRVSGLLEGLGLSYLERRAQRQQMELELERLKFLRENPDLAQALQREEKPKADIFDYIMDAVEVGRVIDYDADATIQAMPERIMLRGMIATLEPDAILSKFVTLASAKGKGERAQRVAAAPNALQFVRLLKQSVTAKE